MIGKITGRIDYIAEDHVLIEAAGVGYVIYASNRTLSTLPRAGEVAALYTEMLVREDLQQLFGFPTLIEKEWHRLLCSVQGIGAKAALAIMGTLGPEGVSRAIALGDATAIKRAPGVGPKIAARVVNELKDKAPSVMALGASASRATASAAPMATEEVLDTPAPTVSSPTPTPKKSDEAEAAEAQADALSALTNLGYGPGDAAAACAEALQKARDAGTEINAKGLIRESLRLLAPA